MNLTARPALLGLAAEIDALIHRVGKEPVQARLREWDERMNEAADPPKRVVLPRRMGPAVEIPDLDKLAILCAVHDRHYPVDPINPWPASPEGDPSTWGEGHSYAVLLVEVDRLTDEDVPLLGRWMATAERGLVAKPQATGSVAHRPSKSQPSLDARAVGVFLDHPDWSMKKIAESLQCHPKSLTRQRCPKLAAAMAAHRARIDPDRKARRGSKDAEGNLEAWDE